MEDKDSQLIEKYQERMCEICQDCIYGQKMNTNQFNLCEGSRCDDALEYLKDALFEEHHERYKYLLIG